MVVDSILDFMDHIIVLILIGIISIIHIIITDRIIIIRGIDQHIDHLISQIIRIMHIIQVMDADLYREVQVQ